MVKFIAQTVFEVHKAGAKKAEFDIQFRIVNAPDFGTALLKAIGHAKRQEGIVTPMEGPDMHWRFVGIMNLYELDEVIDGGEIFSQTHETSEPLNYIQFVKARTMAIQAKNLTFS